MEELLELAGTTDSPFVMVILLALVFGLDPCPMLTNIAAIGYISQGTENRRQVFVKGLWYTLGRTLCYGLLGLAIIILLKLGGNISAVQSFLGEWGEVMLIPFMIVMGVLMCIADYIPGFKIGVNTAGMGEKAGRGRWGAFILGAVLSLGFCPTNAVIFFGIMMPTIQLDPQPQSRGIKIEDERTNPKLPTELHAMQLFIFQQIPHGCLIHCPSVAKRFPVLLQVESIMQTFFFHAIKLQYTFLSRKLLNI